jgi:hypothetical protein
VGIQCKLDCTAHGDGAVHHHRRRQMGGNDDAGRRALPTAKTSFPPLAASKVARRLVYWVPVTMGPVSPGRQFPLQGAGEDGECRTCLTKFAPVPHQKHACLTKFAPVPHQNRTCLTQFSPVSKSSTPSRLAQCCGGHPHCRLVPSQLDPLIIQRSRRAFHSFPLLRINRAHCPLLGGAPLSHCYPKRFCCRPIAAHWILSANRVHHSLPI